jgi:hypothetical protein
MQEICYRTHKATIKNMDDKCLEIYQKELTSCINNAQIGISKYLEQVQEAIEHIRQLQALLSETHRRQSNDHTG